MRDPPIPIHRVARKRAPTGRLAAVRRAIPVLLLALLPLVTAAADTPRLSPARTAAEAGLVDVRTRVPDIAQDMKYAGRDNFVGRPVEGYAAPKCLLHAPAADALARADHALRAQGYRLQLWDCYRPARAVADFVRWAHDLADTRTKAAHYPHLDKSKLLGDYIAPISGHSRGSTVDLTLVALPAAAEPPYLPGQPLVDCAAPQGIRFADNSVDMGTGFDCFDTLAHTFDARIGGDELKNRLLLTEGLERQGFVNYDQEWWHFTYQPEPYPETYFDFPVDRAALPG